MLNKLARRHRGQGGQTLIEVLIALLILGIIAVAFLSGLTTALRGVIVADEHAVAQSLAASQFEYVKNQNYTPANSTYNYATYDKIDLTAYNGYSITGIYQNGTAADASFPYVIAVPIHPDTRLPVSQDMSIQSVTINVYHGDKLLLTLTDYKTNRTK